MAKVSILLVIVGLIWCNQAQNVTQLIQEQGIVRIGVVTNRLPCRRVLGSNQRRIFAR
jgi:hypothetical protein